MATSILDNDSLKNFIISLKLNSDQENVLIDKLPSLDAKERLELLATLKNVYELNDEEKRVLKKINQAS